MEACSRKPTRSPDFFTRRFWNFFSCLERMGTPCPPAITPSCCRRPSARSATSCCRRPGARSTTSCRPAWPQIHHELPPAPWCSITTPWRSTRCSSHHELLPAPWCSITTPWRSTRCSIHHELPPSLAADPPRAAAGALVLDHHALAVNQVLDPPRAAAQPGRRSTTSCCWRPGARSVQTSAQTAHQRLGVVDSAHMGVKKPAKRLVF